MDFTPQTGHVSRNRGQGYVVESGRTRPRVQNGTASNAATTQTRHEYRGQSRQEALPPAKNYAKKPQKGTATARTVKKGIPTSARPGKGPQAAPARFSPVSPDLIDRMFRDGVHMHKIPARVNLKRGQRLV